MSSRQRRLGIDTGGTFTDFAYFDGDQLHSCKVLSTPSAPEEAILQGIRLLDLEQAVALGEIPLVHGTTVATNAALERKGAKTALVTNAGFEDLLTIGRQNRAELYNLTPPKPKPPVPANLCLGLACRVDRDGNELEPISRDEQQQLIERLRQLQVESVAICFLFSWLNPVHEEALAAAIRDSLDHIDVHLSSQVAPRSGEYERAISTWLNASLSPRVKGYLQRLEKQVPANRLAVMQSSGGTVAARRAGDRAVQLLLSGPAGGLAAAASLAQELQTPGLLTFDMGGTSTDVALIKGQPRLTSEGQIAGWPVIVPMVDMHTIGAGGGSIARVDAAGMLHVGPESAGAAPGPACYGLGDEMATVTDAHCLLGHLPQQRLGVSGPALDRDAALRVIKKLDCTLPAEELALGVLDLAQEHMANALRKISEQRGEDPADYRLCSFGGAGGLQVCNLAEKLGMRKALIPAHAGILSALGMLVAPGLREYTRSLNREEQQSAKALQALVEELVATALDELASEGHSRQQAQSKYWLDCRYAGQSFTLEVPWTSDASAAEIENRFHRVHKQTYGYQMDRAVEQVNLRVSVRVDAPALGIDQATESAGSGKRCRLFSRKGGWQEAELWQLDQLQPSQRVQGPALILADSSTSLIQPGWTAQKLAAGHLLLDKQGD